MNKAQKKQKYQHDVWPYIAEGLIREVYEGDGFTVACFANSAYGIFVHGAIDKTSNLTCGIRVYQSEFAAFMELPTLQNLMAGYDNLRKAGEKREFTPTPQLMAKVRELKRKLDAEHRVEVDLQLEQRLVEAAMRKRKRRWFW